MTTVTIKGTCAVVHIGYPVSLTITEEFVTLKTCDCQGKPAAHKMHREKASERGDFTNRGKDHTGEAYTVKTFMGDWQRDKSKFLWAYIQIWDHAPSTAYVTIQYLHRPYPRAPLSNASEFEIFEITDEKSRAALHNLIARPEKGV